MPVHNKKPVDTCLEQHMGVFWVFLVALEICDCVAMAGERSMFCLFKIIRSQTLILEAVRERKYTQQMKIVRGEIRYCIFI